MSLFSSQPLTETHRQIGLLVQAGNRLLIGALSLGLVFSMLALGGVKLLQSPEKALHTQAFMFNYLEFSHVAAGTRLPSPSGDNGDNAIGADPNWDGALAGASVGLTLGRNIPVIGPVVGPALGAAIGYKLDSHL